MLELDCKRRDPETGDVIVSRQSIDPQEIGVVVVDMWNYQPCKTVVQRDSALVPRINYALAGARKLGMQVVWAPTSVADRYVGTPQREYIESLDHFSLPPEKKIDRPRVSEAGGCMCGPGIECASDDQGDPDGMDAGLHVAGDDLIVDDDTRRLYAICRDRGLTHLIYMGVHTNMCVLDRCIGMLSMAKTGIETILERTMTDAGGKYIPGKDTLDDQTAEVVASLERQFCASVDLAATLRKLGIWSDDRPVDPVRVTPWGRLEWPHQFGDSVTVTLALPTIPEAKIYYTLDGSEPTQESARYQGPFVLNASTFLRAIACKDERRVSLPSDAYFVRLPAKPPLPDVFISDLKPLRQAVPNLVDGWPAEGEARSAQMDKIYVGKEFTLRGVRYAKGVGVQAPSHLIYELKPEYQRFVALSGVDESLLSIAGGRARARYPSVVFRVFVQGKLVSESPVMRISQEPWRFDVAIPQGGKKISLAVTEAGNGNPYNRGNWVNAGFILSK